MRDDLVTGSGQSLNAAASEAGDTLLPLRPPNKHWQV
jgi:hypothetical protein